MSGGRRPGMYVGSTSVLMVFAVLCLTIFASLSILSARSGQKLARNSADAVTAYYAADEKAVAIMESIAAGDESGASRVDGAQGEYYNYTVAIDGAQELAVTLFKTADGELKIMEWRVVETGEWSPDTHIEVWDGTSW